jgi:hypothetical protein
MDGVAEEPGETHHFIRLVSREAAARLPAVEGGAGQTELSGQTIQREIKLLPERFQLAKIEPGLNDPHHLRRRGFRFLRRDMQYDQSFPG